MKVVEFKLGKVLILDQSLLPHKEEIVVCKTVAEVADAIKTMKVRGAPAIGVAAAYGMALSNDLQKDAKTLKSARPTAVDLSHAVDFVLRRAEDGIRPLESAENWAHGNEDRCARISEHGADLIKDGDNVLTHCNTGPLATSAEGTALGAIIRAARDGKKFFVYVDETRPRFQGALTSWELLRNKIPHKVITDNSAGFLMQKKEIDFVFVGADRIVKNGDFANKIGTYSVAVIAKENHIPFYVLAPISTFDFETETGDSITIEERDEKEVLWVSGYRIYPKGTHARNIAFDVTPSRYVKAYINEFGIFDRISGVEDTWKNTKE
ncbi:S-methyl-5-thioribose-1-phosphate isomerase [Candidatus Micrarchaeota archaeon]|nr:S-methyl-5-thioribose-1-phosphate isomerase [Candidatus Micrarchaeota archaeon]MBU1165868.1 S-methyl-5-thioribose-1-phosphate isomerase [Candidatus Micrarchaeota archaeon]MBU1886369.1 S-methyl-5-thioribose-1-phosphate isomerase [Candidatus Micrarchaeota archaeon]